MRYFLDTEFNGFGGALISLALVPEYGDQDFYVSLPLPAEIHPWVEQNVIPYLRFVPPGVDHQLSREEASRHIEAYLANDPDPVIIAVSEWVFLDAPQVAAYFGRARMPLNEMNAMLQASSDGSTPEDIADRFVATREEVWRPWLGTVATAPAPTP